MPDTEDLSRFCCLNPKCSRHGRRNDGNLLAVDRYGKARHRLIYCRDCKARFSEFQGTPFFNSRLPHEKVLAVLQHLAEGCGVRQTARLVGVNKDAVTRLALLGGPQARAHHDELVAFFPPTPGKFNSMRSGISSARSRRTATPPTRMTTTRGTIGIMWPSTPSLAWCWPATSTRATRRPSSGLSAGPSRRPRGPGRPRVVPEKRLPESVVDATVHKERQGHRVVAVTQRQVFGTAQALATALGRSGVSCRVNTAFVERQNGSDRGRNARKVRKSSRFSKDWRVHEAMTFLTMYAYNFRWAVRTLRVKDDGGRWNRRSPAMSAGLADHTWTWREWFTWPTVQSA